MSTHIRDKTRAFILSVIRTDGFGGARVSLSPVHQTTATMQCYELVKVDFSEIERLVGELRALLGRVNLRGELDDSASDEVRKLGHLLFDELFPPSIKDFLRERDGCDLLIRTDAALADVPWELLHTGEAYLALRWNLGRLMEVHGPIGQPVRPRTLTPPLNVLVLSDPCGDLDAAYEEGILVRNVLDSQAFLRVTLKTSEVNRAYLRENVREFDILHFAGHAQVDGRGEGWLLSDGRFSAADVKRLCGGRPFPSLVFANACGSVRANDGSPQHTLARQFIEAGVRHFIGAHWDVPDEIASEFAERFYRGLCHGLSVGSALRQARLAMSLVYGHGTILWGSYCLYGDPHHVYFPDAVEADQSADSDFDLPIVESAPTARGIFHTMDIPVSEVGNQGGAMSLGPHPAMRSEAALGAMEAPPSTLGPLPRRALLALLATTTLALAAAGGALLWPQTSTEAPAPEPAAAPAASPEPTPADNLAAVIREQEEAERMTPPRIDFEVIAQTRTGDDALAEIRVNEGTRLRSGDNVRVDLKSDRDAYVALILIDDHTSPQVLFPHPSVKRPGGNYLEAGETVPLPGAGLWYRLDDNAGTETLLVLADKQPIEDLDGLVEAIGGIKTRGAKRHRDATSGMIIRGMGGVTAETARPQRRRGKKVEMISRTRALSQIQSLAHDRDIDVIQAVTYVHGR